MQIFIELFWIFVACAWSYTLYAALWNLTKINQCWQDTNNKLEHIIIELQNLRGR